MVAIPSAEIVSRPLPVRVANPDRSRSGRLQHIDFMRVTVFTFVISAHVVTNSLDVGQFAVAGWGMLMHFTRYAFVFISAFVLFYGYRNRDLRPVTFWRKRFSSIVLPYLLWTAIYLGLDTIDGGWPGIDRLLSEYGQKTLWGTGWYHLYFLLVSMQLYLFFPAIRWFVNRCAGRHGWLLAGATVVQVGYMWMVSQVPAPSGAEGLLWIHADVMLPMYALFITGGALAAVHFDRVHGWISMHGRTITVMTVIGLVIALGVYTWRAPGYAWDAATPTFPTLLPWVVTMTVAVYALGAAWVRRRPANGLTSRIVDAGAQRAFGVFAVHPLVLWVLEKTVVPTLTTWIPNPLPRTIILFSCTVAGALVLVELALHSPVSKLLVARPRLPQRSVHSRSTALAHR